MSTYSRRSSGPVLPIASTFQRSISPSGRFGYSSSISSDASSSFSPSSFASSTSSSFYSSPSTSFLCRSRSPTRVHLQGLAPLYPSPSVRFSIDRSISPGRSIAVSPRVVQKQDTNSLPSIPKKKVCMCSPTTHPGSFRCSLHKNCKSSPSSVSYSPNRLSDARRSAMTNSLVRIGTVEGEWVKRALTALIRPSSHHQKRRSAFQPRPSRLSIMSKAEEDM